MLGLGGAVLASGAASADVNDFQFESLHADYTLGRDSEQVSTLRTVETFVVLYPDFDQNRGLIRAIPTHYGSVDTELVVIGVTDENGAPVPYSLEDDGAFLNVIIGTDEFVHGRTTYVIEYRQAHVVRPFADELNPHQEFYWDVNGTGWAPALHLRHRRRAFGRRRLCAGLNGDIACYQGYEDATDACATSSETEDGFHFESTALGPNQNLSFAIGFVDGTFRPEATPRDNPIVAIVPWVLVVVLALVVIGILWLRLVYWRNAPGRGIVIAQYEAPEGIGIMEAAHLLDRGHTAIPAEIVNLTVQRAVQLVEDAGRPADDRYKLVLVDPAAATERDDDSAIRSLFLSTAPGTAVELDRKSRKLGDRVAALTAQARNNIRTRGFRVRKKSKLAGWLRFFAFASGVMAGLRQLLGRRQQRRQRAAQPAADGVDRRRDPVLRLLGGSRASFAEGFGGARTPAGHPALPDSRGGRPHQGAAEPDWRRAHTDRPERPRRCREALREAAAVRDHLGRRGALVEGARRALRDNADRRRQPEPQPGLHQPVELQPWVHLDVVRDDSPGDLVVVVVGLGRQQLLGRIQRRRFVGWRRRRRRRRRSLTVRRSRQDDSDVETSLQG